MKSSRIHSALVVSLIVALSAVGNTAEFKSTDLNVVVTTDDTWSVADAAILKLMSQITAQSVVAHSQKKGVSATPKKFDSGVLLVYSKLPLGSPGDNPNLILAKEEAWAEEFEKSGAGYLKLMQERVRLLEAPTKFVGEPKLVKVEDTKFYQMDAVNTKVPEAETKQQYLCTFKDGYYVFFILSLNDEKDADYNKMWETVSSFRSLKR